MGQFRITTPDGQKFIVTAPDGVASDKVLETVVQQSSQMGMTFPKPEPVKAETPAGQADKVMGPSTPESIAGSVLNPGQPAPLDPIQAIGNVALPAAASTVATLPLTAGAGTLAAKAIPAAPKLAAAGGRALAAAGSSIANKMLGGRDVDPYEGLVDLAVSASAEAVGGAGGKAAGKALLKSGAPARAFEYATKAPQEALNAVAGRLMKAKIIIPSLDASKKLSWPEMIERLSKVTGSQYRIARAEIADAMRRADTQTLRPHAGQVFKELTAKRRFEPGAFAKTAERVRRGASPGLVRAGADTAAVSEADEGLPAGVVAGSKAAEFASALPVVGPWVRRAEQFLGAR